MRNSLLVILLLLLAACSHFEDKAQQRYAQAEQVEQAGEVRRAERLYEELIFDFPDTVAARKAALGLERIGRQQQLLAVLERLQNIILGYQGMTGRFPQQVADFDDGEYFFSSAYMAELVPEGATAWVNLQPDRGSYQIWIRRAGQPSAYLLRQGEANPQRIAWPELEPLLQAGTVLARKGRLLFIAQSADDEVVPVR